jgi:hypothetical protein
LFRQFETSRWWLVTATSADSVCVSLERSQDAQLFLQADTFRARFDARSADWAIRRTGHKAIQAICAPIYLRGQILIFRAAVRELDRLTETDTRSRSAQIISSSQILFDLVLVFIEFRDVGLVARVGHRLDKRVSALGS